MQGKQMSIKNFYLLFFQLFFFLLLLFTVILSVLCFTPGEKIYRKAYKCISKYVIYF